MSFRNIVEPLVTLNILRLSDFIKNILFFCSEECLTSLEVGKDRIF